VLAELPLAEGTGEEAAFVSTLLEVDDVGAPKQSFIEDHGETSSLG
jgi:hypothetical protein